VAVGNPDTVDLTSRMNEAEPVSRPYAPRTAPGDAANPVQSDYARDDPQGELASIARDLLPVMNPQDVFDDLATFAIGWRPDLVIWDMLAYAGPVAAAACGAAHARLVLASDGMSQLRERLSAGWRAPEDDPLRSWLTPKLARYGLDFDEDMAVGQWIIDLMPAWTWHPKSPRYVPCRHIPFNGAAMVPRWLFDDLPTKPRVCVTLGNSHRDAGRVEAAAPVLLEAVDGLDIEVIATLTADQLGSASLPANTRAAGFVPLNELLPTCAAIVHHGGAGTFAGAVANGVPQLIAPSAWWGEKWYGPVAMASGLEQRGAGVYVADSDRLTAAGLRDSLIRVLSDPSYRRNAEQLRREFMQMPTPNDVVPALERLTEEHRRQARLFPSGERLRAEFSSRPRKLEPQPGPRPGSDAVGATAEIRSFDA
jgi:UDP:flavonoid glycosyltransferase YjiC (YdhE family)